MIFDYSKGLHSVGNGLYAYTQPNGSWGWSNAGLVCDGGESLLVDTLFDRHLTRQMLDTMRRAEPAMRLGTVVNTHANGDHCWGNQEVAGTRIVATQKAAHEMRDLPPWRVNLMVQGARLAGVVGPLSRGAGALFRKAGITPLANMLEAAPFVERIFGPFSFGGITLTLPTETFEGQLDVTVGSRKVSLIEVGPAHTAGDAVVFVPDAGVVFTGDIMFVEGHPIVWEGPLSHWIAALERILALNPSVVVPGHGPITDVAGVKKVRDYLAYVDEQATLRHRAGMDVETAAKDIALDAYAGWLDAERIAVNVDTVYRHLEGRGNERVNVVTMFARMARVAAATQRT